MAQTYMCCLRADARPLPVNSLPTQIPVNSQRATSASNFRAKTQTCGRRAQLTLTAALLIHNLLPNSDTKAAEFSQILKKYVKRKKLDPLETYVPAIMLSQLQFEDIQKNLQSDNPQFDDSRSLLRSGPAASLRVNIRAVAEYASESGDGKMASDAVDECLRALEDLDSLLLRASRNDAKASIASMQDKAKTAVTALDRLLGTVPSSVLEKGRAIAKAYNDSADVNAENKDETKESNSAVKILEEIL
eukprot:TRINITY_DN14782_c0_g1_i1.p1 TRINITY_DN14782_c0_g1~~TRINITY_DN14782_c0_g1_i1.p1  ORF type:complete len:247 (+),score=68.03 TRINITY_DN14782_c0_g1_i1:122-862(+)